MPIYDAVDVFTMKRRIAIKKNRLVILRKVATINETDDNLIEYLSCLNCIK